MEPENFPQVSINRKNVSIKIPPFLYVYNKMN